MFHRRTLSQVMLLAPQFFAAFLVAVTSPVLAFAATEGAEHHAHSLDLGSLLWPLTNFGLYLLLLVVIYRKKIAPILAARSDEIQQTLQRAGAELTNVEREIAGVSARLARMDAERDALIQVLVQEGQQTARAILEAAQHESRSIEQDNQRQREHEFQRVRFELTEEMVKRATARARAKFQSDFSNDDDRRLRDEVLSSFLG